MYQIKYCTNVHLIKKWNFKFYYFLKALHTIIPIEGKTVTVHAVKAHGQMEIQLNSSFNLVQSLVCFSHFTLRQKSTWNSLSRQLGGHQSKSGCFGEQKNLLSLLHIEPQLLNHPGSSLFPVPIMLSLSGIIPVVWSEATKK
jgi:hypothetical protein